MSDLELTMMRRVGELKTEVERLKKFNEEAMAHIAKEERKSRERLEMAEDENARLKADVNELADGLKLASEVGIKMADEVTRLKAEVERLTKQNALSTPRHLIASQDITSLREQVERLTKAVMHSPAAQIKLKELEGKTTFDEINPKDDNSNIATELLVLCNRQASDIRRLTKAGDELHAFLINYIVENRISSAYLNKLDDDWNAAKEGKQS